MNRSVPFATILLFLVSPVAGQAGPTGSLLLLYTNDLHDRVRPDPEGMGGIAFVAGHIGRRVAERPDALVLDAGDVVEKGDMVGQVSRGELTYELLSRIGYHAGTPGNHDYAYGLEQLMKNQRMGGFPLLAVDVFDRDTGAPLFEASRIFRVGKLRVGVIGVSNSLRRGSLARFLSGRQLDQAVAGEAGRLEPHVDLTIVLAHQSPEVCRRLALAAPQADVFVSGHNHERIDQPLVVEETRALIVQAQYYARLVGELDLIVDIDHKRVASSTGKLVEMRHDQVMPDAAVAARVVELERQLCPEAGDVLTRLEQPVAGIALARLLAQAMRRRAQTEVALCSPEFLRDKLPAGDIDINAVNRIYVPAPARRQMVVGRFTGREILRWIEKGTAGGRPVAWDGFEAETVRGERGGKVVTTTLDAGRLYRVALAGADAEGLARRMNASNQPGPPESIHCTVIDALVEHLRTPKTEPAAR